MSIKRLVANLVYYTGSTLYLSVIAGAILCLLFTLIMSIREAIMTDPHWVVHVVTVVLIAGTGGGIIIGLIFLFAWASDVKDDQ